MDTPYFTVSQFNKDIQFIIEECPHFKDVWISGEISQLKFYSQGNHYYFFLSDGDASINCVIYSNFIKQLQFKPTKGQHVIARGKLKFYPKKGTLLFQIAYMSPIGKGTQTQNLEALKKKLQSQGIFSPEKKQPIPSFPKKIGLITSENSAAMWDFVTILRQHNSFSELCIIPTIMQGDKSLFSIIESIDLAHFHNMDVIVIARGGGTQQELDIFNNEHLVKKIADSTIPLITAIGHQTDQSLSDLAADTSCATPTASAQLVNAPLLTLSTKLNSTLSYFSELVRSKIDSHKKNLYNLLHLAAQSSDQKLHILHNKISYLLKLIDSANPISKLAKGYSITYQHNTSIKSVKNISTDDILTTELIDGKILSKVSKVIHDKKKNNSAAH